MTIKIKRAYEAPDPADGERILVDRLWPRGVKKEAARIDLWLKEIAPDDSLRKWFGHQPEKWDEFKRRYFKELQSKDAELKDLRARARRGRVCLVYAARDAEHNNAVALKEYLDRAA